MGDRRRKSLLIGINYVGSQHQLKGCHQDVQNVNNFLSYRGYPQDQRSQVVMLDDSRTDPSGPFFPNGHNILAAMEWLVSEPNTTCMLHYSGHGGQVRDSDGDRSSGFDDTIVPFDFETRGQISSDTLHRHLVSRLPPSSTLFVIFDCCHSGSALELPFIYRSDSDGNVNMMDDLKKGANLAAEASHLLMGGLSFQRMGEAKQLYAGATDFFRSLKHQREGLAEGDRPPGLAQEGFAEDWEKEKKYVTMFSGCKDEQTSADASIGGSHVGAMSWAFLETMKRKPNPAYLEV